MGLDRQLPTSKRRFTFVLVNIIVNIIYSSILHSSDACHARYCFIDSSVFISELAVLDNIQRRIVYDI